MPNDRGSNQFQKDYPHGERKRMMQLQRSAPMSGAPTPSAEGAPKRAQKRAVQGQQAPAAGAAPSPPVPPTQAPYSTELAMVYQQLAQEMPDDELVRYYAELAAKQASGG